jgi:ABC-type nitrate/sulfonate/bicarbonate transport system substrate-binding protein
MSAKHAIRSAVVALCVVLVACGGDDDDDAAPDSIATDATSAGSSADTGSDDGAAADGERLQVRLAFQPEATLRWMETEGIIDELEDEYNAEIAGTETFDPGPAFLGNRADVISVGTFEIAAIEEETGMKTVTFGRTYDNPYVVVVRADEDAETLADLVGKRVTFRSGGSGGLTATILAKAVHDLDLPSDGSTGGDFEVIQTDDHLVNLDLLLRGDTDAVFTAHNIAAPYLRTGELKTLYDDRIVGEIMTEAIGEGKQIGWGNNNLVAREDWFDTHPEEVQFLLALYERAAIEWEANKDAIVRQFPEEFNMQSEEDVDWILDIFETRDPIPDTAYLDQDYVDGELKIIQLMKDLEIIDPNLEDPRFELVQPE